jgi:hypothetical protein
MTVRKLVNISSFDSIRTLSTIRDHNGVSGTILVGSRKTGIQVDNAMINVSVEHGVVKETGGCRKVLLGL